MVGIFQFLKISECFNIFLRFSLIYWRFYDILPLFAEIADFLNSTLVLCLGFPLKFLLVGPSQDNSSQHNATVIKPVNGLMCCLLNAPFALFKYSMWDCLVKRRKSINRAQSNIRRDQNLVLWCEM